MIIRMGIYELEGTTQDIQELVRLRLNELFEKSSKFIY